MRAEIDEDGVLHIHPTTKTEETALKAWAKQAFIAMDDPARNADGVWRKASINLMAAPDPKRTNG